MRDDDDFDFPSSATTKDMAKIKAKIEEFGKYLGKQGYCYHIFATPKEIGKSSRGGMMAAVGSVSMNPAALVSHVGTLLQNSDYLKAAMLTVLLIKKGRLKIKHLAEEDQGFFSKFKKMF